MDFRFGYEGFLSEDFMNTHLYRLPARHAMLSALVPILLGATAAQAQPQSAVTTLRAAADPNANPTLPYRSVFSGYQKFGDEPVAPWSQTNATVEKIGGWRAYAKEAQQPDGDDKAGSPDTKIKTNTSPGTGAHGDHGGKP